MAYQTFDEFANWSGMRLVEPMSLDQGVFTMADTPAARFYRLRVAQACMSKCLRDGDTKGYALHQADAISFAT